MDEASPLKVRRYLEFGLPVILGYTDTDLAGVSDWWVLRLPNTPANVVDSLEEIRAFVFATRGRRVPRSAVEPLVGAGTKETARLRFLSEVAARSAQVTPERSETRQ
jgi:hypothetical protein